MSLVQKYLPNLRKAILLALFYAGLAFAYSFIGFLHPEVSSHYHEYIAQKLFIEIVGHFSFGFIASIPFFDIEVSLLTGSAAVLIDTDHILSALDFNVTGRPDHSFLFFLVSATALIYVAQRMGLPKSFITKLAFVAPVVLFSHISYDIFSGTGSTFQLFIPFSFQTFDLPYYFWIVFEIIALGLSTTQFIYSRRSRM
ncbi:MAG: hypothetical protein ACYCQJ_07005 [Nitrososphaerales archaeon]